MSTILVTGASGMLGRAVLRRLDREPGVRTVGLCHSRSAPGLRRADLSDAASVPALLDDIAPDAIIHAAAIRKPDEFAADVAASRRLNVDATAALARWTAGRPGAYLAYVSSDYVFDGSSPPYRPDDPVRPVNAYGRSKADGEDAIRALVPGRAGILRVPILYGDVESLAESSATAVAETVRRDPRAVLDDWAVRYPTHVDEVADILAQMALRKLAGTYHWSGTEALTKYDLGVLAATSEGRDASLLRRSGAPANGSEPRPRDCHLDRSALERLGVTTPAIRFTDALRRILARFP